jgi:hypothetical protein
LRLGDPAQAKAMTSPVILRSGMVGVATAGNPSEGILAQFVPLACRELATAHLVTETAPALSTGILAYATPSICAKIMIFVADCRRRVAKPLKLRK